MRNIIFDLNGGELASLYAHFTTYTSNGTCSHYILTFILGAALNQMFLVVRHQLNQMLRTYGNTFAAGLTCILVYHCHTIYNVDGVKRTCLNTRAFSKASIVTASYLP